MPDEFDQWVRSVVARLESRARALDARVADEYASISHLGGDRGVFARAVQRIADPSVRACMFLLLDGRSTGLHVWRAVRPEVSEAFVSDDEA